MRRLAVLLLLCPWFAAAQQPCFGEILGDRKRCKLRVRPVLRGATDVPLLIATDHDGIVRYIRPAPDNALVPNALIDQIADRIMQQWPLTAR